MPLVDCDCWDEPLTMKRRNGVETFAERNSPSIVYKTNVRGYTPELGYTDD
jgi:hypothetical protein